MCNNGLIIAHFAFQLPRHPECIQRLSLLGHMKYEPLVGTLIDVPIEKVIITSLSLDTSTLPICHVHVHVARDVPKIDTLNLHLYWQGEEENTWPFMSTPVPVRGIGTHYILHGECLVWRCICMCCYTALGSYK